MRQTNTYFLHIVSVCVFFFVLIGAMSSPVAAAPVCVKERQTWEYGAQKDEMRGTETKTASVAAQCLLNLKYPYSGGSPAILTIGRSEGGYVVYLTVSPGQFARGELVTAKFDDGPLVNLGAGRVSQGSPDTLIVLGENEIIERLKTARRLVLEVVLYGDGAKQIKFDVSGFSVAKLQ